MVSNYLTHIFEAMNALTSGYMPGIQDSGNSVYIVNKLQNNAFSMGVTTDYKMRHMITRDPEDKKLKMEDTDNQDDYGFDCSTSIRGIYKVTDKAKLSEGMNKIISNIGNEVDEGFIYECLIGDKMYDYDQIEYSDQVEKVFPFTDSLKAIEESIRNYTLYGKEKAELLAEVKYGDKSVSDIITEYKDILLESSHTESYASLIKRIPKQKLISTCLELQKVSIDILKDIKAKGMKVVVAKDLKDRLETLYNWADNYNPYYLAGNPYKKPNIVLFYIFYKYNDKSIPKKVEDEYFTKLHEYIGNNIKGKYHHFNVDNTYSIDPHFITEDADNIDAPYIHLQDEDKAIISKELFSIFTIGSIWNIRKFSDFIQESSDISKLDKNHKRKDQYNYKTIDLYDDECFKYFDRKEIVYYRNDGRNGEILVEKDYNSAIGYIYVKPGKDNKNNIIGPFNVFPAYRGRGYGEILLNDAIKKYGANLLEVYKDNEVAIELYKKAGFKVFKEDDKKLYMHL